MTKIIDVEGIGEAYAKKLGDAGITTIEMLLEQGSEPKGRKAIGEKTGISDKLILEWLNRADLARISGVGSEYADLLELAGVDTVPELAQRVPANLHEKMVAINAEKEVVRKLPALSQVEKWIEEAKQLPRIIHY
jgi:predicted flap endonuclease-1-like 5' DNA nuclease